MQSEIIDDIRDWHRKRNAAMEIRKRADLALGANLRTWLGWRKDLPEIDRKRIEKCASDLIDCGEKVAKGKPHNLADTEDFMEYSEFILMAIACRSPTDKYEDAATKTMERLAKQLPIWQHFGEPIKGFGARSLAVIIGETGDLSNYSTHSKLWRRMGMAPYSKDGITRSGKQWKLEGGLGDKDWVAFGYSPKRRSAMFVIEEALYKQQGFYREIYLGRKKYLRERAARNGLTVAPSASIPVKHRNEFVSLGYIDQDAKRYMGKRLLKHLWQAWRRASTDLTDSDLSTQGMPAAFNSVASQEASGGPSLVCQNLVTEGLPAAPITEQRISP